jgi:hypothetical protein
MSRRIQHKHSVVSDDCSIKLFATENEKPHPGLTPNWGFSFWYHPHPYEVRAGLFRNRFPTKALG